MNKQLLTLFLVDFSINAADLVLPNSQQLEEYKSIFTSGESNISSILLRQVMKLLPSAVKTHGVEKVDKFVDSLVDLIDTKLEPINAPFFKMYLKSHTIKFNGGYIITVQELIDELEQCVSLFPINNISFESEVCEKLLSYYVVSLPESLPKMREMSNRVKELTILKNASTDVVF